MSVAAPSLFARIAVGDTLPAMEVALTTTGIVAAAIATRDYQPVHHDLELVHALGNEGIFVNTHTTAGYLERFVTSWAGPGAFLTRISFRLGTPNYAGDSMRLTGEVTAVDPDDGVVTIRVKGVNSRGSHVEGVVSARIAMP